MFRKKVCPMLNHCFATLAIKLNDRLTTAKVCAACHCYYARANAGPLSPVRTATVATWKSIERQLQELPFTWFEASDGANAENHSPNTQHAGNSSASVCKAVLLLSPAPQKLEDLRYFSGNQGKLSSHNTSTFADQLSMCLVLWCSAMQTLIQLWIQQACQEFLLALALLQRLTSSKRAK